MFRRWMDGCLFIKDQNWLATKLYVWGGYNFVKVWIRPLSFEFDTTGLI